MHQHGVGAVEPHEADRHRLVERLAVDADVARRERLERAARAALRVGGELREASLAEDARGQVRDARTPRSAIRGARRGRAAPRRTRCSRRPACSGTRPAARHDPRRAIRRHLPAAGSTRCPGSSRSAPRAAATRPRPPSRSGRRPATTSPSMCRNPPSLAPSSRITAGSSGGPARACPTTRGRSRTSRRGPSPRPPPSDPSAGSTARRTSAAARAFARTRRRCVATILPSREPLEERAHRLARVPLEATSSLSSTAPTAPWNSASDNG